VFVCQIYKSTKCNDMQQTGYCPRGPFCAFAHVDRKYLLTIQLHVHFALLYNMSKSFSVHSWPYWSTKLALVTTALKLSSGSLGFLNWCRKEISSIMSSQLNQMPNEYIEGIFDNFT